MKHANLIVCATACAIIVLVSTSIASADPISIVVDSRGTTAGATVQDTSQVDSQIQRDLLFSSASVLLGSGSAAGSARVTSSFADPMHWVATGTADGSASSQSGLAVYDASAQIAATFEVTEPVAYDFNLLLQASFIGQPSTGFGDTTWDIFLGQSVTGGQLPTFIQERGRSAAVRSFSGALAPGRYQMQVVARNNQGVLGAGTRSATAGFDVTFDFAPLAPAATPEPASLLLLGTGVAGLFGYRRRAGSQP